MTSRFSTISRALLATLSIVWVALEPIAPFLHQAFANHAHVYCQEHHRIEDADARLFAAAHDGSRGEIQLRADALGGRDSRRACQFAYIGATVSVASPVRWSGAARVARPVPVASVAPPCLTVDPIRFAPKTSPPLAA